MHFKVIKCTHCEQHFVGMPSRPMLIRVKDDNIPMFKKTKKQTKKKNKQAKINNQLIIYGVCKTWSSQDLGGAGGGNPQG